MNLNDFKVQSEADDSYHLVHPSGKTFTVQKKGLNEKALSKIKKMACGGSVQRFDDGGNVLPAPIQAGPGMSSAVDVPDYRFAANATPTDTNLAALQSILPNAIDPIDPAQAAQNASSDMRSSSGIDTENAPAASQPVGASGDRAAQPTTPGTVSAQDIPIQGQTPASQPGMPDLMGASLDKQESAIKNSQSKIDAANAQVQGAYGDYQKQLQAQKTPDQIFQENKAKDDQLMQHYMDQKIDPNRYLANKSTGSKILSAIGIALSGAGAGAHGTNLALEGINKAIENDIGAQQSEQGKAMNLFKMNREQTQSEQQAHAMTTNQLLTGVQAKIAMAGAQSQNAEANLRGQMMIQQIEQQKAENRQKLALMQGGGQTDPLRLVSTLVPAAHQQKAITEIGQAQAASKNESQMMSLFDQAAKDNTIAKRAMHGESMPASMLTLNALGDPLIHDQDGRVNEFEKQDFAGLLPQQGDLDSKVAEKRKGLQMFINNKKAAPTAQAFGINPQNFASTTSDPVARLNPQQQRIYQIAMANPGLPQSQLALKKLGVK